MTDDDDTSSNPLSDEHLPAAGEGQVRDDSVPLDPADDTAAPYQDDFDTDDNTVDPIMHEENDDPTEELGVPASEFKNELDKYDTATTTDDRREEIEDLDEADDNAASAPQ